MTEENWEDDLLAEIYRVVVPCMWAGHRAVALFLSGSKPDAGLITAFDDAYKMLVQTGPAMLTENGISLREEDLALIRENAAALHVMRDDILAAQRDGMDEDDGTAFVNRVERELQPAINKAVRRFRRAYIGHNMKRQHAYADQAQTAVEELNRISKQIFFISINASVEAARVGEAGRGFSQISTDIRALSESAQNVTRDLTNIMGSGSRAS